MKRRAKMLDLLLVAVKPEYQNKGVNALLFADLIPYYIKHGFIHAETNPELLTNNKVRGQWEYFDKRAGTILSGFDRYGGIAAGLSLYCSLDTL